MKLLLIAHATMLTVLTLPLAILIVPLRVLEAFRLSIIEIYDMYVFGWSQFMDESDSIERHLPNKREPK